MELTIAGPARHAWRDGDVVTTGAFVQEFRFPTDRPKTETFGHRRSSAPAPPCCLPGAMEGAKPTRGHPSACSGRRGRFFVRGLRSRFSLANRARRPAPAPEHRHRRRHPPLRPTTPLPTTLVNETCHGHCLLCCRAFPLSPVTSASEEERPFPPIVQFGQMCPS